MFNDQSSEPIGFASQTSTDKSENTVDIQTEQVSSKDAAIQLLEQKNAQTQTSSSESKGTQPRINYDNLAEFLKRVTPSVLNELDEIHGSNAFDNYHPSSSAETPSGVKLKVRLNTRGEADTEETKINCLTWSGGGGTLAISHSRTSHDTWCDHLSSIKFFDLTKDDQLSSAPNKSLELNSCVTDLSYHPVERSILAAGLFNGDVLIWNLSDEKSLMPFQLPTHGDSVSVVKWRLELSNKVSPLVTASRDGFIFFNELTTIFTAVDSHKRYKIRKEYNPSEKTRPRSASGRRERAVEPGLSITALDFSANDPKTFVVGTLCGGLYKCNTDRATAIEGSSETLDPVTEEFERHRGSVTSVIFTPSSESFVTSGTDKEIRIYDLSQFNSLRVIDVEDTTVGLSWLTGNAEIFAGYGVSRTIIFYNYKNAKAVPNLSLETCGKEISALRFNAKRDLVAAGNTEGSLEIWKIPRNIAS